MAQPRTIYNPSARTTTPLIFPTLTPLRVQECASCGVEELESQMTVIEILEEVHILGFAKKKTWCLTPRFLCKFHTTEENQ
jgi:hypothetical protein